MLGIKSLSDNKIDPSEFHMIEVPQPLLERSKRKALQCLLRKLKVSLKRLGVSM